MTVAPAEDSATALLHQATASTDAASPTPPTSPLDQVVAWLADAAAAGLPQPFPIALATATRDGRPSNRYLLLERVDGGFVFSSNVASRKGQEIAANPWVALALHLTAPVDRQVRAEGQVRRLSRAEAAALFAGRERAYQLLAHLPQGRPVSDPAALRQELDSLEATYPDQVPLPYHWASYLLVPEMLELFEDDERRLKTRHCYRRGAGERWVCEQLVP